MWWLVGIIWWFENSREEETLALDDTTYNPYFFSRFPANEFERGERNALFRVRLKWKATRTHEIKGNIYIVVFSDNIYIYIENTHRSRLIGDDNLVAVVVVDA